MFLFNKKKSTIDFKNLYEKIEDGYNNIPVVKKRRNHRLILRWLKYFFYLVLLLMAGTIIVFAVNYVNLKNVYKSAFSGKSELETAVNYFKERNFQEAYNSSSQAEASFQKAYENLNKIKSNPLVAYNPALKRQIDDLGNLVNSVEILSKATIKSSLIGQEVDKIISGKKNSNFADLNTEEKRNLLKYLFESNPELVGIEANLELSLLNIEKIHAYGILWPIRSQINELKTQLQEGVVLLANTVILTELGPAIAGYPSQTNYLMVFQNSDELRPTGGFIGNYGLLEVKDGDILRLDTHDTYHLDLPIAQALNIPSPEGLDILAKKWYLRDANWSPDFPTTAQKIEWFYWQEENLLPASQKFNNFKGQFDGVIALNPKFITDLLEITGPIVIDGVSYNKENFNELVEYKIEIEFAKQGLSVEDRKQLIGKIVEEMKNKLYRLPSSNWTSVIKIVTKNIQEKNILVYFKNDHFQNLAVEYGLAGEMKKTAGDYVMAVDANLAAFKTDAIMNKAMEYKIEEREGNYYALVRLNYANQGNYNWRYTNYKTYTRVYVPLGSELIKAEGITKGEVKIGEEFSRTYFAGYIEILPGKIGTLSFEYKLPENIAEQIKQGQYALYIQKQPGNNVNDLTVDVRFANKVKSYQPTGFYVETKAGKQVKWKTELSSDRTFTVTLDK